MLPPLAAAKTLRRCTISLSKPLHISKVQSLLLTERRSDLLWSCKAYEADLSQPILESSETKSEATRKLKIGIYFATWWSLNAYPFPWLTSMLSLAAGFLIMLISWALGIAEVPKTDLDF